MTERRIVYLFRSGDESDPYEEALAEVGYTGISIAVLAFETVHAEALREALEHPRSYDGMIFTSPRAVEALASAMGWLPTENVMWHAKSIFAVGARTAYELRQIGFEPSGEGSGSAGMLAEHIAAGAFERPLLFLCGNRRRDELPDMLRKSGIDVEELCVYESHPRDAIDLRSHPSPDWVVFFSPSGLQAVERGGNIDLSAVHVAAIGDTTAEALRSTGLQIDAIAGAPTPDALVQALLAANRTF